MDRPTLILVLLGIAFGISHSFVHGSAATMKDGGLPKPRGTVKTITTEVGDVIDCVDILQQPAFNHPLLRNHTIQMKPDLDLDSIKLRSSEAKPFQTWHKSGECPKRTIPILRIPYQDTSSPSWLHKQHRRYPKSESSVVPNTFSFYHHEYSTVSIEAQGYYGASAELNVWNPFVQDKQEEFSVGQIWVSSGDDATLNTIEAGWLVHPSLYNDNNTRFSILWTRDNYKDTGCFNLLCSGFVQVTRKSVLGGVLAVSVYGSTQEIIKIQIYKNTITGHWWLHLQVQDDVVGYWPSEIFTGLAGSADAIEWGGEIVNGEPGDHHTSTKMGSGHFFQGSIWQSSFLPKFTVHGDEHLEGT